ncbi:glycosyltransferase family 39 protein [Chloroflexota bacterium]
MPEPWGTRVARWVLPAIVILYLILGTLYALLTPAWQAPDEPAHYNYVRFLAEQHRFPLLKPGDYPADYMEEIKAAHFPPDMSIDPIRYEFHQPPLYYLIAVPTYQLFRGALLPLRLLSLVLGALLLLVVYWIVREVAPHSPCLALAAAAFVAFLPMHLAMTAAANNDTLAELLLALILLFSIRYLKESVQAQPETRLLVLLGVTTGLGLVTKSSVYFALPLVLIAILARHLWLDENPPSMLGSLKAFVLYLLPAVAMALPWWLRSIAVYGGLDFLGLGRHELVVAGQLRTADFVAQNGLPRLLTDLAGTTFRSFWGQFGWMGVLLDQRIYQALAILSSLALVGFLLWAWSGWRRQAKFPPWQWAACGVLVLTLLFTAATYLWYNAGFLQHQGRYLFRALVPISLAVALGWREVLRRDRAVPLAALLLVGGLVLGLVGRAGVWPLLMLVSASVLFLVRRFMPDSWDPAIHAVPYLALIPLNLACLFLFIIPQLAV